MIFNPEGREAVGLEVAAWHILCLHRDQHRWTIAQHALHRGYPPTERLEILLRDSMKPADTATSVLLDESVEDRVPGCS